MLGCARVERTVVSKQGAVTVDRQPLEVDLDQPFRLARGQELRVRATDLTLRKIGLTRQEPARGFEELGEEYTLTLEVRLADGAKRRSFSWREHDAGDVRASWAVGPLVIAVDRQHLFRVTRLAQPAGEPVTPPPAPTAGLTGSEAASAPPGQPASSSLAGPPGGRELVTVRRKRRKRRRSRVQKVLETVKEGLKAFFWPPRPVKVLSSGHSKHRHGHRRRRSRPSSSGHSGVPRLSFEQKVGWSWSLEVREGERRIGVVHGANPFALMSMVEDYLVAFGAPRPGCSLLLRNVRTRRELTLDRAALHRLGSEHADELLRTLDSGYPRHSHRESGSTTVMTDENGQPVKADDLLARVFDRT
jgi:hypothetical protein